MKKLAFLTILSVLTSDAGASQIMDFSNFPKIPKKKKVIPLPVVEEKHTLPVVQTVREVGFLEGVIVSSEKEINPVKYTALNTASLNIFEELLSSGPDLIFGTLRRITPEKKPKSFECFYKKEEIVGKYYTFKEIKELIDKSLRCEEMTNERAINFSKNFSHICHPYLKNTLSNFGDYAAEYILSSLIQAIDSGIRKATREERAEAYYQLSQTYTHLCVFKHKIDWADDNSYKVKLLYSSDKEQYKTVDFTLDYKEIYQKRLDLLKQAVLYNPKHSQSWVRILEIVQERAGLSYAFKTVEVKGLSYDDFSEKQLGYFYNKLTEAKYSLFVHFTDKEKFKKELERVERKWKEAKEKSENSLKRNYEEETKYIYKKRK